jgi:SPASM domain peptide maturase of grasp-with-spasm system
MQTMLSGHYDEYFRLHADCIPVKGATRSAICDLTRNELVFFPSEYFEVLEYLNEGTLGDLMNNIENEEEKTFVTGFIDYLDQHELVCFLKEPGLFPAIEERWETPCEIQNAIIDVDLEKHDFKKIFRELDELGCQFVQIRSFSGLLKITDLYSILSWCLHKSVQSVEVIIKYDRDTPEDDYIRLIEEQPIIAALTVHSSPEDKVLVADFGCGDESGKQIKKQVRMVTQQVDAEVHCGVISINSLNAPTVGNFFETKLFNGCLNRKVSIDSCGEIKNCPSMAISYGNTRNMSLARAVHSPGFTDKGKITKDQVKTCRDCELRYVCSDCRAYVEDPADEYSKPLKCGYDPYTCVWEEWSSHPMKQKGIDYYRLASITSILPASIP